MPPSEFIPDWPAEPPATYLPLSPRCDRADLRPAVNSRLRGGYGEAVPTIVFHGDRDTTVNPVNGDHVIAQSKAATELRTTVDRGEAPGGIRYTRNRSGRRTRATDAGAVGPARSRPRPGLGCERGGIVHGAARTLMPVREMMRFFFNTHLRPPSLD